MLFITVLSSKRNTETALTGTNNVPDFTAGEKEAGGDPQHCLVTHDSQNWGLRVALLTLEQQFPHRGDLCLLKDIWSCLKTVLFVTVWDGVEQEPRLLLNTLQ